MDGLRGIDSELSLTSASFFQVTGDTDEDFLGLSENGFSAGSGTWFMFNQYLDEKTDG